MSKGEGEGQGVDRQPEEEGITVTSLFVHSITDMPVSWLLQELTDALDNKKKGKDRESEALRILRVATNTRFLLLSDGIYSIVAIVGDDVIPPYLMAADHGEGVHSCYVLYARSFHFICRDICDINHHCTLCSL